MEPKTVTVYYNTFKIYACDQGNELDRVSKTAF